MLVVERCNGMRSMRKQLVGLMLPMVNFLWTVCFVSKVCI